MKHTGEQAFEAVIDAHLLANGYVSIAGNGFDRNRALFPETILAFIRETQPKEWAKLESLHGDKTGEQILGDLCKWMDIHGSLATLRHGFKCYGRTFRAAYFKAAHELNPELESRYAANRLGLTRQIHFSPRSEQSLDVTLSLNGIPVATLELKNPLTGQRVEDARRQYKQDRDPREPIFEFKRRTLVHFAVDTESVLMTTRLAGAATHFLPFDRGCAGAAGNPPDPAGRTYRTAYLWEEVLQRDSLLDLLARFIHLQIDEKRDDQGRKVKTESMIFPRYHQLEAVRMLVDAARSEGVGHSYLVEHSAGSGKSNTIGWLRVPARCRQRARLRQRDRGHRPRRARSAAPGHDLPVRTQARRRTADRRKLATARRSARECGAGDHHHLAEISFRLAPVAQDGRGTRDDRHGNARHPVLRGHRRRGAQLARRRDGHRPQGSAGRRGASGRSQEARGRGRPGRPGRALPQHGQAGQAGEPELLCLHRHPQAQDARRVRP